MYHSSSQVANIKPSLRRWRGGIDRKYDYIMQRRGWFLPV